MKIVFFLHSMISLALLHCARLVERIADPVVVAYKVIRHVAIDFVMVPFRTFSVSLPPLMEQFALIAFRLIGRLKPEYSNSYDSHGLNFST